MRDERHEEASQGHYRPKAYPSGGFSDEEKAAMKERAKELKAEARANKNREDGERVLLAAIAAMKGSDRAMAEAAP